MTTLFVAVGVGRICRSVLYQRRVPPLSVVKYTSMPIQSLPTSASEICVSTVIVERFAIDMTVGDCCVALRVVPSFIVIETTVPSIGAKRFVYSSCVLSVANVALFCSIDFNCAK